jgi:hypothetical protein
MRTQLLLLGASALAADPEFKLVLDEGFEVDRVRAWRRVR